MQSETGRPDKSHRDRIAIVIPVFNDWESLARLLPAIDTVLGAAGLEGHVTVVDDGSAESAPYDLRHHTYAHLPSLEIVRLRCNLGHQRAIAVGMTCLDKNSLGVRVVVIMDGDGEDRPEDVPSLLAELSKQQADVVFAARTKRTEGFTFRLMYLIYRFVFWLFTGTEVRVGNFSAMSCSALSRLVLTPNIWNHYAATVLHSRMRFSTVGLPRGKRYSGKSHMRYSRLVAHGLSSVAVFGEVVGARLIILCSGVLGILLVVLVWEIFARLFTTYAIPVWAVIVTGVLVLFAMQGTLSILILAITVLGNRSQAHTIPVRQAEIFIESIVHLKTQEVPTAIPASGQH